LIDISVQIKPISLNLTDVITLFISTMQNDNINVSMSQN